MKSLKSHCERSVSAAKQSKIASSLMLLAMTLAFTSIALAEVTTLQWGELSDRSISANAKKALAMHPESWQHAETDHFVYHFPDPKSAETIVIHAETYYQWVKQIFGLENDDWRKKAHVFVFDDKPIWQKFCTDVEAMLEGQAFTDGRELFILRDAFWLAPAQTLAHEITHILLFRFLEGEIPLVLNEGFAQFVSFRAISTKFGGDEYRVRLVKPVPAERYRPVQELLELKRYPNRVEDVKAFYQEGELLVRFLILKKSGREFYTLLKRLARGEDFEELISEIYGWEPEEFEANFRKYAVNGQ